MHGTCALWRASLTSTSLSPSPSPNPSLSLSLVPTSRQAAGLALPVAAEAGHLECTELLLGAGVSREAMVGALLCAERMGRVECAALVRRALQQDETQEEEAAKVARAICEIAESAVQDEDAGGDYRRRMQRLQEEDAADDAAQMVDGDTPT